MKKYKIATSGYMVVEIEADSPGEAEEKVYDEGLNTLFNQEIHEVVEAGQEFKMFTDLNDWV